MESLTAVTTIDKSIYTVCSYSVSNCELVAIDKDSATMLHSLTLSQTSPGFYVSAVQVF